MLHTPNHRRKSSSLPTVLVALALASVVVYFAYFRPKGEPAGGQVPASSDSVSAPASRPAPADLAPAPAGKPAPSAAEADPGRAKAAPAAAKASEPKAEEPRPPAVKPEPPPPVPASFEAPAPQKTALQEIDALCAEGRWREARAKLAPLFAAPGPDLERVELARKGIEINLQLLVHKPDEKDVDLYEIQQGDTLEGIARKFRTLNGVKGAVMLVNNYKENAILRAGRKVKVPRGTWSVLVDKSLFKLWICYEGAPFKAFAVTIGTDQKTPAARFVVGSKNPKPAWWPPAEIQYKGKIPVPYGDPQNPLGDWWIALDHDMYHGIGIHGTNDPASIGSKASNGCVRMLNEEVGEVAAVAYKGMPVTILE
jgi:hypothetical protein